MKTEHLLFIFKNVYPYQSTGISLQPPRGLWYFLHVACVADRNVKSQAWRTSPSPVIVNLLRCWHVAVHCLSYRHKVMMDLSRWSKDLTQRHHSQQRLIFSLILKIKDNVERKSGGFNQSDMNPSMIEQVCLLNHTTIYLCQISCCYQWIMGPDSWQKCHKQTSYWPEVRWTNN